MALSVFVEMGRVRRRGERGERTPFRTAKVRRRKEEERRKRRKSESVLVLVPCTYASTSCDERCWIGVLSLSHTPSSLSFFLSFFCHRRIWN
jgi:hypothetical protein